jgi:hypothetical protein
MSEKFTLFLSFALNKLHFQFILFKLHIQFIYGFILNR